MKVYSLYYEGKTYICSFPTREDCVQYGKQHYDGWQCDIVEEYLSRSPLVYSPPHYTHLGTAPVKLDPSTGITVYPGTAQINTTRAETENTIYAPGTK
jgi:hypothetical protein